MWQGSLAGHGCELSNPPDIIIKCGLLWKDANSKFTCYLLCLIPLSLKRWRKKTKIFKLCFHPGDFKDLVFLSKWATSMLSLQLSTILSSRISNSLLSLSSLLWMIVSNQSGYKKLISSSHLRRRWVITTPLFNSSNGLFRSAVLLMLKSLIKILCRSWNLNWKLNSKAATIWISDPILLVLYPALWEPTSLPCTSSEAEGTAIPDWVANKTAALAAAVAACKK